MSEFPTGVGAHSQQNDQEGRPGTGQQAKAAAGEVAGTAKDQAQAVAGEARLQTRRAVGQLRERVGEQTEQQSRRAAQGIRQWADELASMSETAKPDSPVSGVVQQVADTGRRAADYLEQHGLSGVTEEVQNFARRRPGVFLAGAVAAGFLVGRMAKATTGAGQTPSTTTPPAPGTAVPPVGLSTPAAPGPQQPSTPYSPAAEPPPPGGWGGEPR